MAVKYFGVHEFVTQTRIVEVWKKVAKKHLRVDKATQVSVPNPELARIQGWAKAWQDVAPPKCRGNC